MPHTPGHRVRRHKNATGLRPVQGPQPRPGPSGSAGGSTAGSAPGTNAGGQSTFRANETAAGIRERDRLAQQSRNAAAQRGNAKAPLLRRVGKNALRIGKATSPPGLAALAFEGQELAADHFGVDSLSTRFNDGLREFINPGGEDRFTKTPSRFEANDQLAKVTGLRNAGDLGFQTNAAGQPLANAPKNDPLLDIERRTGGQTGAEFDEQVAAEDAAQEAAAAKNKEIAADLRNLDRSKFDPGLTDVRTNQGPINRFSRNEDGSISGQVRTDPNGLDILRRPLGERRLPEGGGSVRGLGLRGTTAARQEASDSRINASADRTLDNLRRSPEGITRGNTDGLQFGAIHRDRLAGIRDLPPEQQREELLRRDLRSLNSPRLRREALRELTDIRTDRTADRDFNLERDKLATTQQKNAFDQGIAELGARINLAKLPAELQKLQAEALSKNVEFANGNLDGALKQQELQSNIAKRHTLRFDGEADPVAENALQNFLAAGGITNEREAATSINSFNAAKAFLTGEERLLRVGEGNALSQFFKRGLQEFNEILGDRVVGFNPSSPQEAAAEINEFKGRILGKLGPDASAEEISAAITKVISESGPETDTIRIFGLDGGNPQERTAAHALRREMVRQIRELQKSRKDK